MNQIFYIFEFAKTKQFLRHCLFSDKSGSRLFYSLTFIEYALKPSLKAFGKTAIEKVEQNELVKQATVTVTDVAKKGAQYVENAPLIKDFNEEQKKFIRFETHSLKF